MIHSKAVRGAIIASVFMSPSVWSKPIESFPLNGRLGHASVRVEGDTVIASTGLVERRWRWGENGLVTTSLKNLQTNTEWVTQPTTVTSDWNYPPYTESGRADLVAMRVQESTDEGFANPHLEWIAEVNYAEIAVQYIVWVFPDAEGFRTQLKIKRLNNLKINKPAKYDITPTNQEGVDIAESTLVNGRTEYLPIATDSLTKRAVGYYNDTQNRNLATTPILRDEMVKNGPVAWASVLSLEGTAGGIVMVKESHKCVNQAGVNTGIFNLQKDGVEATGWGILPQDFTTEFQGYWANWVIIHSAKTAEERELALKKFDRVRYPIDPKRDLYIMANTWGSGGSNKRRSKDAAQQENVKLELDTQSELGIDTQQIDDGWQGPDTKSETWRPVPVLDYGTAKDGKKSSAGSTDKIPMYPDGWGPIRQYAQEKSIRLGLWCHNVVPLEDLKWNFDQGGFRFFKIDFVSAYNFEELNKLMGKMRAFVLYTDHQVRINWDATERYPRFGYFFGREYGNVYLANRKPYSPSTAVYIPYLVLRDAWQLSKYINLNKFQITVQNGAVCNPDISDAYKHRDDYLTAQSIMGSPIFFQETHLYSPEARAQIKPVLAAYRAVRDEMFNGYVFPIGQEPDNRSWSGFQNVNPDNSRVGFITLFRQLENQEPRQRIQLHFVQGRCLTLTNLLTGETQMVTADSEGNVEFSIKNPGGFLFLRCETKE